MASHPKAEPRAISKHRRRSAPVALLSPSAMFSRIACEAQELIFGVAGAFQVLTEVSSMMPSPRNRGGHAIDQALDVP
jgi:hypothetical protein